MNLNKCRMLDLSVCLDNNPYTDPPPLLPKIDYMDHQEGWPEMAAMFPGLRKEDLPGNESWRLSGSVSLHIVVLTWMHLGTMHPQRMVESRHLVLMSCRWNGAYSLA